WKSSPSMYRTRDRSATAWPTADFPTPEIPMTTTSGECMATRYARRGGPVASEQVAQFLRQLEVVGRRALVEPERSGARGLHGLVLRRGSALGRVARHALALLLVRLLGLLGAGPFAA